MSDEDVAEKGKSNGDDPGNCQYGKGSRDQRTVDLRSRKCTDCAGKTLRIDSGETTGSGTDHRGSGGICQCGSVERVDPFSDGYTVYCGSGTKRRKQYCSLYLQCIALYAVRWESRREIWRKNKSLYFPLFVDLSEKQIPLYRRRNDCVKKDSDVDKIHRSSDCDGTGRSAKR